MKFLGRIQRKKIYYIALREDGNWKHRLPKKDWIAFTIANEEDEELVASSITACLDKNVSYTCSVGEIASRSEDYFDEEFAWRNLDEKFNPKEDSEDVLMTTFHTNFSEGFWFATVLAMIDNQELEKVVCLDFTKRKVKNYLIELIHKINDGWLPSEKKVEHPVYDK